MCNSVLKFRSCSTPARQFWATGEGGFQFVVQGKVYKLSNYSGANLNDGLTFAPLTDGCTAPGVNPVEQGAFPCDSTFTIDSSECFELIEILSTCDSGGEGQPANPWSEEVLLGYVNGFRIEELYDKCESCLNGSSDGSDNNLCEGTPTTTTSVEILSTFR